MSASFAYLPSHPTLEYLWIIDILCLLSLSYFGKSFRIPYLYQIYQVLLVLLKDEISYHLLTFFSEDWMRNILNNFVEECMKESVRMFLEGYTTKKENWNLDSWRCMSWNFSCTIQTHLQMMTYSPVQNYQLLLDNLQKVYSKMTHTNFWHFYPYFSKTNFKIQFHANLIIFQKNIATASDHYQNYQH